MMHIRQLGQTDVKTSVLGMGSSQFRYGRPERCAQLIEQAVELGITYYDTARSYKNGEEAIGCLPAEIKDKLVVATKTGVRGGSFCLHDLQRSLKIMRHDRIDVWMTHMLGSMREYELCTDLGGFCDIAYAARKAGLIRAVGASFHAPTEVILKAITERAFDVVMFQLNLIGRETVFGSPISAYRDQLIPAARENGVGIVVMKVLAGGEMQHGVAALRKLVDPESGLDELGMCVRYACANPAISSAVVGMATTEELVKNVLAVEKIDDSNKSEFDTLNTKMQASLHGECTRCGLCLDTCPEGIEIPKIMRLFDQGRFFEMHEMTRYKYSLLEVDAAACTACGQCMQSCPESFDIPELLKTAHMHLQKTVSLEANQGG